MAAARWTLRTAIPMLLTGAAILVWSLALAAGLVRRWAHDLRRNRSLRTRVRDLALFFGAAVVSVVVGWIVGHG